MEDTFDDAFMGLFTPSVHDPHTSSPLAAVGRPYGSQTPVSNTTTSQVSTPADPPSVARARRPRSPVRNEANRTKLRLLRPGEWDEEKDYNEQPPTCLHYTLEWCAVVNGKEVLRDTEPDLVLNPAAFWHLSLQQRMQRMVGKHLDGGSPNSVDYVVVVVSVVNCRSARKLTKRFESEIDWRVVEDQLHRWSDLFEAGKTLRLDVSFHYEQSATFRPTEPVRGGRRRRGATSTTQRMHRERHSQLTAEEESTGAPPVWNHVYTIMKCQESCDTGPHCWRDPVGKKHYKLYPHHLKSLIDHVEEGGVLESQDDVPQHLRRELYAEEQQRRDRNQSKAAKSSMGMTPITINNHFPNHTQLPAVTTTQAEAPYCNAASSSAIGAEPLEIPSPLDLAVREYSEWQKSRVRETSYKAEIDKACTIVMSQGRDLRQIHNEQDVSFLVDENVNIGTAKRYVSSIAAWVQRRQREENSNTHTDNT